MNRVSCVTPDGQVTIPRSIMKSLGINGGNDIVIEVENGRLILKKAGNCHKENGENMGLRPGRM